MKNTAISWEGATEALERFLDDHAGQPVRAAFTTFNFHAESFQRSWMRKLRRARAQVLVLADRRELRNAKHADAALVGFQLAPVGMSRGVFHPKLVMVRAGDALYAAIGSGNLTAGGLGGNLELQLAISTRGKHREPLADGIAGVLRDLAASPLLRIQATARRFLALMTQDIPAGTGVFSSLSHPLLEQIRKEVPAGGQTSTTLLSPWHANTGEQVDASVIGYLRKHLGGPIQVLTEGDGGRAPDLPNCQTRIYGGPSQVKEDGDDEQGPSGRPSRLHAKSVIVRRADRGWWFLGSANATRPALCQSVAQGGNMEVLAMVPLDARGLAGLERTWDDLFVTASAVHRRPSTWKLAACGTVLGGELIPTSRGLTLRLTAYNPAVRSATLLLPSPTRSARTVVIPFLRGEATLTGALLHRLIPNPPDRRQGASSMVLDELHGGKSHSFVVSIPLQLDDEPNVDIADRLEEELRFLERRWPVARPRGMKHSLGLDTGGGNDDEDLDELTSTQHQGRLDRLAEQLYRIGRLLSGASHERTRERLAAMCGRDLEPHLQQLVVASLLKANR